MPVRPDTIISIMQKHPRILLGTVGYPRAGKSSWVRNRSCPIVSPDEIRLAMHGQNYIQAAEPFVWATAIVMVRALFGTGERLVLWDATNTTKERRRMLYETGWTTFWHHVDTPYGVCVERAMAANRGDLVPVILHMHAKFEPLDASCNIWPEWS